MARRTPPTVPPAMPPVGHAAMMWEVDQLPLPPKTQERRAVAVSITQTLTRMADDLHAKNLANGVALAQQAAGQGGPLADVFAELGRRYSHLLTRAGNRTGLGQAGVVQPPASAVKRLAFQLIEGGAD